MLKQTDPNLWPGGAGAWKETDEKARGLLHLGYQRMLTFQDREGGFALYPRHSVETTAMAANAFLIAGVHQPLWEPMLNYLGANRASWGGWGTTQATVWSLTALQQMRAAPGRTEILVRLGGQPMAHAQGDGRPGQMIIDSEIALMQTFREEGVSSGPVMMNIASTDTTPAMYRATAEYAVPWNSSLAADTSGIAVSLDVPERTMAIHTNQTLTARLKNTGTRRMDTLIAELPLPPGAFVSRDQFEAFVEKGSIDHFEILPTHVRIYLPGINAEQTLALEYTFASMLRGEMVLPPLRAYQFYTPRPLYEIDGGPVVVP